MRKIKEVPFNTFGDQHAQHAAFICIFTRHARPWAHYPDLGKDIQTLAIPTMLMVNRWDGDLGFPGGTVDPGEDFLTAAVREAREEIGLVLTAQDKIEEFIAHEWRNSQGRQTIAHLFTLEVENEEDLLRHTDFRTSRLHQIQKTAHKGEHFGSEILGIQQIRADQRVKDPLLSKLFGRPMAPSVKEEILAVFKTFDFFEEEYVDRLQSLHFDLD